MYATIFVAERKHFPGRGMSLPEIIANVDEDTLEDVVKEAASFFPFKLGDSIRSLTPDVLHTSEQELTSLVEPKPLDYALRKSFWKAVDEARLHGKEKIPQSRVYEGVCSRSYFEDHYVVNPIKVAWLVRPIVPHESYYEALNRLAMEKIFEYLKDTKVNEKTLSQITKIAEMSANRAYGAVIQKTHVQSRNLNVEVKSHGGDSPPPPDQLQLSQKIEAMQAQLMATPKDVTPKE
jgi:hypothetical protein